MLLYNGYPSSLIDKQFRKFSFEYLSPSSFLPIINDEQQFKRMRQNILGQPTPKQSQVVICAVVTDLNNNPPDEESTNRIDESNDKKKNYTKFGNKIIVHYIHVLYLK